MHLASYVEFNLHGSGTLGDSFTAVPVSGINGNSPLCLLNQGTCKLHQNALSLYLENGFGSPSSILHPPFSHKCVISIPNS